MKKIFVLAVIGLFSIGFSSEASAFNTNDGVTFEKMEASVMTADVIAEIPTAVDNVVVSGSVVNVVAVATVNAEVGGSIVSSDADYPDQDNLYATTTNKRIIRMMHLLSLRKHKKYLADNYTFKVKTNNTVGKLPANIGKSTRTYS